MKALPSKEVLREFLSYSEADGKLFWKPRKAEHFSGNEAQCRSFNSRMAGREALAFADNKGYLCGRFMGKPYKSHRIIYKLAHGEEPNVIDHIDGDKSNNRIANLRSVDVRQNSMNIAFRSDNKSGGHGVHFCSDSRKWIARIVVNGEYKFCGAYRVKELALAARKEAEIAHGFHPNHGRIATGGIA